MLIKKPSDIRSSEITPESVYRRRRELLKAMLAGGALMAAGPARALERYELPDEAKRYPGPEWLQEKLRAASKGEPIKGEALTPYRHVTGHNNFYEFGLAKEDPKAKAQGLKTDPWKVEVGGECGKPGSYYLEDLLKTHELEERIYRLRCVEAWSMVIPWVGVPLHKLISRMEPTANAKFVEFTTLHDSDQMPGQKSFFSTLSWPYTEGLRIDEAMHPLTLMAVGVYGDALPPQNGAPFRLVVPWKYGFKSIKSIVSIRFTEQMPRATWNETAPNEYGFYANVNPKVDHPRWSQATERRLPSSLFNPNQIDTRMFNGYADQVAHLYQGMDLRKWY